jgi:hypothetical protein
MSSKVHHVANLVSSLGGPSLNLDDIAWANDSEAENLLLSWLADQLCESTTSLGKGIDETQERDEECKRHARAAIGEVALEPEEVLMFVHHPHSRSHFITNTYVCRVKNIQNVPQNMHTASQEYMPPSRLKYVKVVIPLSGAFDNQCLACRRDS